MPASTRRRRSHIRVPMVPALALLRNPPRCFPNIPPRRDPSRGPRASLSGNRLSSSLPIQHLGCSRKGRIVSGGRIPAVMPVVNAKSRCELWGVLAAVCVSFFRVILTSPVPVRCLRIYQLYRMYQSQGAMSIHQRDKQTHVVHQVRANPRSVLVGFKTKILKIFKKKKKPHSDRKTDKSKTWKSSWFRPNSSSSSCVPVR